MPQTLSTTKHDTVSANVPSKAGDKQNHLQHRLQQAMGSAAHTLSGKSSSVWARTLRSRVLDFDVSAVELPYTAQN